MSTVKVAFSLPDWLDDDLAYIASKLNVSKSGLLTSLLQDSVKEVAALFKSHDAVVASGDMDKIRRFRGDSIPIVLSRVDAIYKSARSQIEGDGSDASN